MSKSVNSRPTRRVPSTPCSSAPSRLTRTASTIIAGFLNSGTPTVYQFDASTGKEVTKYTFKEDNGAYIKAIGTDDRGYVYMGIANAANNGAVYFSICTEKGLAEQKWVKIDIDGKVGVNGAYARQIDGKYYLWFVTNYDTDRIYCYDVTDVKNPVPNTAFGKQWRA